MNARVRSDTSSTWAPVDLDAVLAGDAAVPQPTMLARTDGALLLYPGELHGVIAEPESGKGWFACAGCAERLAARERVAYIDFEDCAANVIARLLALGVPHQALLDGFSYIRPDEPLTAKAQRDLDRALANQPTLVVLDGLTEALTLHGADPDSNRQVAEWLGAIPRPIQAATGAAVLMIDHVTKAREGRGRWPIGAQHKLAGVAAAFGLDVIDALGRARTGTVKITVVKDRHGALREHAAEGKHIATMRVASTGDGVTVTLEPPATTAAHSDAFRPTVLMERVSLALEQEPGLTRNAVRDTVKGKATYIDLALELLTAEGFIEVQPDGQARRHHVLTAYRQANDPLAETTESRPSPDRVPTESRTRLRQPGPRVPPPTRGTRSRTR